MFVIMITNLFLKNSVVCLPEDNDYCFDVCERPVRGDEMDVREKERRRERERDRGRQKNKTLKNTMKQKDRNNKQQREVAGKRKTK